MLFNGYFMSKYFTKKGCADKAYKAWIPVAYTHQVIVMAGMNPNVLWLYFLVFIPIINIFASLGLTIFIFVAHYRMVKKYDGSDTAAIAITLLIFGGIFFPIYLNFTKEETPESLEIINNIDADQYF